MGCKWRGVGRDFSHAVDVKGFIGCVEQMSLRGAGGDAAILFGDCRGRLGSLAMTAFTLGY
jgi:hypothetical protein